MKKVAKKLLSLVVVVCIAFMGVFTVPTFGAKAATTEETLTLKASTGTLASDQLSISWVGTNISFVNEKDKSTTAIRTSDTTHFRAYQGSKTTISTTNDEPIVSIVITCESGYGDELQGSLNAAGITDNSINGNVVTINPAAGSTSITFSATKQWRLNKVVVTYGTVTDPTVTVDGNNAMFIGDTQTLVAEVLNTEGTPTWTSSNADVATVESGVVTAKAMGKTTITADVNGTTGSIEIAVWPSNAEEITIAEAVAICAVAGNVETPYAYTATGVITKIDTAYDASYKNISVTISDGTGSIQAFRLKGGQNLKVGTKITVTGKLMKYNTTNEFNAGCTYTVVVPTEELNAVNAYTSLAYTYTQNGETFETSDFRIRFGVDAALTTIEGAPEYGIQVTVGDTVVKYTTTNVSWTVENGYAYVVVDLGDIINDMDKLNTVFTVAAYIVVDGTTYVSTATKPHSVATMVAEYYANEETKAAVEHLYNYLNA